MSVKNEDTTTRYNDVEEELKLETDKEVKQDEGSSEKNEQQTISKGILISCLGSLTLIMFLMAIDVLIVSTIIDQVSKEFGDYSKTGWLVTGYSLPNALLSLVWGRIANLIGFRMSLSFSVAIFELGSLVAAVSQSMNTLIGGRVIAGIGGSGIQTLTVVIACTLVSERMRPMVVSILMSAFAVASVVGPIIGGAFTTHVTWRWCFWINLPIGGFAIALFLFCYNPNKRNIISELRDNVLKLKHIRLPPKEQRKSMSQVFEYCLFTFDIGGLILTCVGLVLFLLGLSFGGGSHPWKSGIVIAFIVIGVIVTAVALVYEFRLFDKINPKPQKRMYRALLSWDVISKRAVYTANVMTFLLTVSYNGQMIYSVQFFQIVFGSNAWKAGLHLIPLMLSSVLSALIGSIITKKTGNVKFVLLFGTAAGVIGAGLITILNNYSNKHTQIGVLILPGVALGAALQAALIGSQLAVDPSSPAASSEFVEITAFNGYMKSLGATLGGILSTTVFGTSAHRLVKSRDITEYVGLPVDKIVPHRLENYDGPHSAISDVLSIAVRNVFWMDLIFAGLAFVFSLFTTNRTIVVEKKENNEMVESECDTTETL